MFDKFITSPNYSFGRNSYRYIVLHTTEGKGSGAVAWFQNPASQVSAHYVVTEDPVEIIQMVAEENTAWHAGRIVGQPTTPLYDGVNPNLESIGIECAGYAAAPLAPNQVTAVAALIRDIRARRGNLPLVGHFELSPGDRSDPGQYNLDWIKRETEDASMNSDEIWAAIAPIIQEKVVAPQVNTNKYLGDKLAELNAKIDGLHPGTPAPDITKYIDAALQEKFNALEMQITNDIITRLQNG